MFNFEGYQVYKTAQQICLVVDSKILKTRQVSRESKNQLHRAAMSILLNIAEGSGRQTNNEKRNFYTIARGSCYECVALTNLLALQGLIDLNIYKDIHEHLTNVSKMLSGMIKTFK